MTRFTHHFDCKNVDRIIALYTKSNNPLKLFTKLERSSLHNNIVIFNTCKSAKSQAYDDLCKIVVSNG